MAKLFLTPPKISRTKNRVKIIFTCLLYTSDAADERSSVDLGGRRIIKKKNKRETHVLRDTEQKKQIKHAIKKTNRR